TVRPSPVSSAVVGYVLLPIGHTLRSIQAAANDEALDIVGPLIDLGAAHAAIDALHAEVLDIADAAKRLDGVGADRFSRLRGKELGHRGFSQARPAGILERSRVQRELARGFEARCHVGETERDGLVLEDWLAEGLTLMGVAHGNLERRPRHAHALGGDADAPAFQVGERDAVTATL